LRERVAQEGGAQQGEAAGAGGMAAEFDTFVPDDIQKPARNQIVVDQFSRQVTS